MKGVISSQMGVPRSKILFTDHHASHAAAAFLTAPTRRAAILTADGVGEWATLTTGHGTRTDDGTDIRFEREIRFPDSLGLLYSAFTAYLGFTVNEGEYKVMGLAAYGRPTMIGQVNKLIRRTSDGAFVLDPEYFDFQTAAEHSYSPVRRALWSAAAPLRAADLESKDGQRFADCAASVQRVLEDMLVDIAREPIADRLARSVLRRRRRAERRGQRSHSGGVGVRARVAERAWRRRCAWRGAYADRIPQPGSRDSIIRSGVLPLTATNSARAARRQPSRRVAGRPALLDRRSQLAEGRIVGWMEGASSGRVLSAIAAFCRAAFERDARSVESRHQVPRRIPPFAPVVPRDVASRYSTAARRRAPGAFHVGRVSGAAGMAAAARGVTHVDGTARVQVLDRDMAPALYAPLEAWTAHGHPGVAQHLVQRRWRTDRDSSAEGYSTFRRCGIDLLVAGSTVVRKRTTSASPTAIPMQERVASWG